MNNIRSTLFWAWNSKITLFWCVYLIFHVKKIYFISALYLQKAIQNISKTPDLNTYLIYFSECLVRYLIFFAAYAVYHGNLLMELKNMRNQGALSFIEFLFACFWFCFCFHVSHCISFFWLLRTEHLVVTNTWKMNIFLLQLLSSFTRKSKYIRKAQ